MDLLNKKPWLLYVLLFFLPPVGIYFMYKMQKFSKLTRAMTAIAFGAIFLIELSVPFTDAQPTSKPTDVPAVAGVSDSKSPETSPKTDAAAAGEQPEKTSDSSATSSSDANISNTSAPSAAQSTPVSGSLKIHFLDVGQADSILIQSPDGTAVLVDAGNNADGTAVVNYLNTQGVKELAAVVATHPHEDHIGGMDTVIKSFTVKQVYMPNATSTSKTFEDMIAAINASSAKRIQTKAGVALDVPGISGTFLAPNGSSYDDLNNYSAVLKITYGSTSFLLEGDAEDISEAEMLKSGQSVSATLLKVGHHGSSSSTTSSFLKAVSPKFAVISVGTGNTYGHPTQATLDKLASAGVSVYRTDQAGTIVATSDGSTITIDKSASPIKPNAPPSSTPSPTPTPAPTPAPAPTPTPAPSAPASASGSVSIASVDLSAEVVTITNSSGSTVDLTGWKLVSEEGNQTYNFPAGTSISVGGTLKVVSGNKATSGPGVLVWTKSYIWNNDGDPAALYNAQGEVVSRK